MAGTLTTTGVNASKGGVTINPASNSGKAAAAGTAQAMLKIHNPPGPRESRGQTSA